MNFDTAAASASGHITGKHKGAVTEDAQHFFASAVLHVQGTTGDTFLSSSQSGLYGTLRMGVEDNGRWVYVLDNSLATTQALNKGDSVLESFVVQTTGGLSETITIVVKGADEAASAAAAQAPNLLQDAADLADGGHWANWADFISLMGLPQA